MTEDAVGTKSPPKGEEKQPLLEDIMQLARLGEIGPIRTLFEQGKYDATFKDHEGITPLHVSTMSNTIRWGSH